MQILTIRGSNLASLAGNYAVDLTQEPLRSAGLFAIIGETGAGKSTILDTMCLALYGKCPRLGSAGVNDDVPDASGESIKSSDPRSILRLGATTGYAEVTFIAPDGLCYKATWAARRARDKADGRLQNVDRSLMRVDDGTILESNIRAMDARVPEITGLSYEEFRRTILLAQGDFDAFLQANTNERAALLEKVTGTEIYRRISRRTFEKFTEAKNALEVLEAKRAAYAVMTPEQREALEAEVQALIAAIAARKPELARLTAEIATHRAITTARTRVTEAEAGRKAAQEASDAAEAERLRLAAIRKALGLRSEVQARRATGTALTGLLRQKQVAEMTAETARESLETARQAFEVATEAYSRAEAEFKEMGPIWSQATRLDGLVAAAQAESAKAERAVLDAQGAATEAAGQLEQLSQARDAATAARDLAETEIADRPTAGQLADRWPEVRAAILQRAGLAQDRAKASRALAGLEESRSGARAALADLDRQEEEAATAIRKADMDLEAASDRLSTIREENAAERMERLRHGREAVRDMERASTLWAEQAAALEQAETDLAEAQRQGEAAAAVILEGDRDIPGLEGAIRALTAPLDRAEAAVSDRAAHLRQHLAEGEPCPVCGATEHPVAADDVLADQARALRADLDAARAGLAQAETARRDARSVKAAADKAAETQRRAIDGHRAACAAQAEAFATARSAALASGLTQLPEHPERAAAALTGILAGIERRREEIQTILSAEAEAVKAVEALQVQRLFLSRQSAERAQHRQKLTASLSDTQEKISSEEKTQSRAGAGIEAAEAVIAGPLAAVNRGLDTLDDTAAALSDLQATVDWWTDVQARKAEAERTLAELSPRISTAESRSEATARALTAAQEALRSRAEALDGLRQERAALLGGEATDSHRTRHNDARLTAQTDRDEAGRRHADARSAFDTASESLRGIAEAIPGARVAADTAARDLEQALETAGLTEAEALALLEQGPQEAERIAAALKVTDDTLVAAVSTVAARTRDLEDLLAAGVPETPEADLLEQKAQQEDQQARTQERLGAAQGALRSDTELVQSLADLDRQIAEAGRTRDVWLAVNHAIGSREGGRFVQIAQAITLGMLVERANLHLQDLKPRYHLVCSGEDLALHIVDRDMGDEIRSTRSLSGGERFLVSLALALALSGMGSRGALAGTLFIDEGFGSLDAESLDVAIDALERLQAQGRTIGVISHVEAMKDRIPVQIRVRRRGNGASTVELAS